MSTGAKIGLYVGLPLLVIIILYFVFFGIGKKKTSSRIAEIDNALRTARLSSSQVQDLIIEKQFLQGKI